MNNEIKNTSSDLNINNEVKLKTNDTSNDSENKIEYKLENYTKYKIVKSGIDLNRNVEIKCENMNVEIKTFKNKIPILKNINLEINTGEIVVILGPSGSGKTTLLNAIAGMEKISSGSCYVKNKNIANISDKDLVDMRKKYLAYIYQRYGLIPILNCLDNIRMGQNLVKKENRKIDLEEIIDIVGIREILYKFPHEVSGGQRQRVAIARAIVKEPDIMICDEPTGALDTETSNKIIELFLRINELYKTTMVIVTHDNSLANIANKIINIRDGWIESMDVYTNKERDERLKRSRFHHDD